MDEARDTLVCAVLIDGVYIGVIGGSGGEQSSFGPRSLLAIPFAKQHLQYEPFGRVLEVDDR